MKVSQAERIYFVFFFDLFQFSLDGILFLVMFTLILITNNNIFHLKSTPQHYGNVEFIVTQNLLLD